MKRLRITIALVAAVVVGLLAYAVSRPGEPRHQGRTLTEWITVATYSNRPVAQNANQVLKRMAPGAVPWLLKSLQAKDSRLKQKVAGWFNDYLRVHMTRDYECIWTAEQGFRLLGEDAKQAWPELILLTQSPDSSNRGYALLSLSVTKLDKQRLMPILMRMLDDPNRGNQLEAAGILIESYSQDAEAAGVHKKFPQLDPYE